LAPKSAIGDAALSGAVRERPILFSAPMVRAIIEGRKTQTRRLVKPPAKWATRYPVCDPSGMAGDHEVWWWDGEYDRVGVSQTCPYGVPGDLLWVREAWTKVPATAYRMSEGVQQTVNPSDCDEAAIYAAGWDRSIPKWRPSIHMPRWASRITLRITDVRVERLNDISGADAKAEGITGMDEAFWGLGAAAYRGVWERINGPGSWDANPWVWVVAFEVVTPSSLTPAPQDDAEGGVLGQHGNPSKDPAPPLAPDQPQKLGDVAADAVARLAGGVDAP
jgi:hypothetical protein